MYELTIEYYDEARLLKGSRNTVLKKLRQELRLTRRKGRSKLNLDEGGGSLPETVHNSKVITISSVEIESTGAETIIKMLNDYGENKYKLIKH